jgi:hypothetical protein
VSLVWVARNRTFPQVCGVDAIVTHRRIQLHDQLGPIHAWINGAPQTACGKLVGHATVEFNVDYVPSADTCPECDEVIGGQGLDRLLGPSLFEPCS